MPVIYHDDDQNAYLSYVGHPQIVMFPNLSRSALQKESKNHFRGEEGPELKAPIDPYSAPVYTVLLYAQMCQIQWHSRSIALWVKGNIPSTVAYSVRYNKFFMMKFVWRSESAGGRCVCQQRLGIRRITRMRIEKKYRVYKPIQVKCAPKQIEGDGELEGIECC